MSEKPCLTVLGEERAGQRWLRGGASLAMVCLMALFLLGSAGFSSHALVVPGESPGSVPESDIDSAAEPLRLAWSSTESDYTSSVAWGDYDGDGDLDLAVGNQGYGGEYGRTEGEPNRLYRNNGGTLSTTAVWSSAEADWTTSVAWGDYDHDGDLDLVAGNAGAPIRLYRNDGGVLTSSASWSSSEPEGTNSLAWGDYDGDGDLDLAAGSGPVSLFRNDNGVLSGGAVWRADGYDDVFGVAWGDYDGDGDLDLVTATDGQDHVYRNEGGTLASAAIWSSSESERTYAVAWGDYDADGDFDLAAGHRVYHNDSGTLTSSAVWSASEPDETHSVAWGDFDGDGDLDLSTGNGHTDAWSGQPSRLYSNAGVGADGAPDFALAWSSPEVNVALGLAWGDMDGDGDLDLAVANFGAPNRVFVNDSGALTPSIAWSSGEENYSQTAAWGDYDGDGDLDLAAGSGPAPLYRNDGGMLTVDSSWEPAEADVTTSDAWGDYDGDGDLDLAIGNGNYGVNGFGSGGPNRVYRNDGGALNPSAVWSSPEADATTSVAWGDYDGDGDLDFAVGNFDQPNRLYRYDGVGTDGNPIFTLSWSSAEMDTTYSVAWGDYDGDGDLDLIVGNGARGYFSPGEPNRLYRNESGVLTACAVWSSSEADDTRSVAWGDYDGDGDLDLAVGNIRRPSRLYRNDGGTLAPAAAWASVESSHSSSVAWGDYDGDGDLDLAVGNGGASCWDFFTGEPNLVYRNDSGVLTARAAWSSVESANTRSVAWGDYDDDGDLDLFASNCGETNQLYANARNTDTSFGLPGTGMLPSVRLVRPAPPENAGFFSAAKIWPDLGQIAAIHYTLRQQDSRPVSYIRAYYSPDGGGRWLPAVAAPGTITTNLATSALGIDHVYDWDVFASGFFGQSDNVVFRIVAVPDLHPVANSVPGPFMFGSNASDTFPFRVRGTQVRVTDGDAAVADALVYRQPAGGGNPAELIGSLSGEPFKTDGQGYLQGRGAINPGDRLFALAPITATDTYTLYHTNALPTSTGLDGFAVTAPGVQTLEVSASHPLVLFNLDVSLEWDARNDAQFLSQLTYDLKRASEFLFDWTNGQAALGRLTVHHSREMWQDAHIRIYASNRLRPSAVQGGIVGEAYTDTAKSSIVYYPGQLYMGAVWNRYGNAGSSLDEDWPRTLAHELGHYALYLQDNYLGKNAAGQVVPVDSCAGAMADPYRDDAAAGYGEFHPAEDWLPACETTLSHLDTGRSDWETISTFYPDLDGVTGNTGPTTLPLAVTDVRFVGPAGEPSTLKAPIFYLTQAGQRVQPGSTARAFLFRGGWAADLGRPSLDQLLARGARPGDRVCLYELSAERLGCETVGIGDDQLELTGWSNWQPDIRVSPVTSRTLTLEVAGAPQGLALEARLYPLDTEAGAPIPLSWHVDRYAGTFTLSEPVFTGYVRVWAGEAEPRREAIVDYTLGSNAAHIRSGGGHIRSGGAHIRSGGAPVMSADGQVILFAPDVVLEDEWFYTLQATSAGVQPPPWATLVGQAYWLSATENAPDLADSSISFSYLGSEVPPGEENWLKLYFFDGAAWQPLPTQLDTYHNLVSAPTRGPGLYALLSSIEVPVDAAGWNFISYPVQATRPVADALTSITGYYTTVYSYRPADASDPWKVYDVTAPHWVNDLENLEFGRGYWLNVSEALVLRLKGGSVAGVGTADAGGVPAPPATYYGPLAGRELSAAGALVTAWVGESRCGQGRTLDIGGERVYSVDVSADGPGARGCGTLGAQIRFRLGGQVLPATAEWDNRRLHPLALAVWEPTHIFLPVILQER